jgi:type I restriction enzyme, S subunit
MNVPDAGWAEFAGSKYRLLPLKRLFRIVNGATPSSGEESYWDGRIPWATPEDLGKLVGPMLSSTRRTITDEGFRSCGTTLMPPGSIVLSTRAPIGHVALAETDLCTNQGCKGLIPGSSVYSRFFYYVVLAAKPELQSRGKGTTFVELSFDALGSFPVPVPKIGEQRTIADFLDRETARIDQGIDRTKRLDSLVDEHRDELIETWIRGGPTDVHKRKSGVSWIPSVPAHWKVLPLKRIATRVSVGIAEATTHAYCDEGVPLVRSTNVWPNRLDTEDLLKIEPWFACKNKSKTLLADDLLTVRSGVNFGDTAVVPSDLAGAQCFTMLITSLRKGNNPHFFSYYLNSRANRAYFEQEAWGAAQANLSVPILQMAPVPIPPSDEQDAIVSVLAASLKRLEQMKSLLRQAEERLRIMRSSLISAAVTGQIDVLNYKPQEIAAVCP